MGEGRTAFGPSLEDQSSSEVLFEAGHSNRDVVLVGCNGPGEHVSVPLVGDIDDLVDGSEVSLYPGLYLVDSVVVAQHIDDDQVVSRVFFDGGQIEDGGSGAAVEEQTPCGLVGGGDACDRGALVGRRGDDLGVAAECGRRAGDLQL